ncbi:MAG: universal stress protein [Haloferacaceae archaeon]
MRLLVAVDGSDPSAAALDHALSVADAAGGSVTAVHAVDPSVYASTGDDPGGGPQRRADRYVVESAADAEERGRRLLDEAATAGDEAGVGVETELLRGDPREVIPALAEREGFDELVVGHRGLPDHQERVLGSVAKSFVERSAVPVTVVP